jgi:hypothetical protein
MSTIPHLGRDKPARLIFTLDFHELLKGDLEPGRPCLLAYAPNRIVPDDEVNAQAYNVRPVVAHLQFRRNAPPISLPLPGWRGDPMIALTETDEDGAVLSTTFTVPPDAEWVMAWFSYADSDGHTLYDSDFGRNFMFRFLARDLILLEAAVVSETGRPTATFICRVAIAPAVDSVRARYRITNQRPEPSRRAVELHQAAGLDISGRPEAGSQDGMDIWETRDVTVPPDSTLAFDLQYSVGDRIFKDDNQGQYFLAMDPAVRKQLRPALETNPGKFRTATA